MEITVTKTFKVNNCNECPFFKEIEDTSVCVDSFDEPNYDWYCTNAYADNKGTTLEHYNDKHGTSLGGSFHRGCICEIPDWCPFKNKQ